MVVVPSAVKFGSVPGSGGFPATCASGLFWSIGEVVAEDCVGGRLPNMRSSRLMGSSRRRSSTSAGIFFLTSQTALFYARLTCSRRCKMIFTGSALERQTITRNLPLFMTHSCNTCPCTTTRCRQSHRQAHDHLSHRYRQHRNPAQHRSATAHDWLMQIKPQRWMYSKRLD